MSGLIGTSTLVSGGAGASTAGVSSATDGVSTCSDVSITEGRPLRELLERLSRALLEAAEELGGFGMSLSAIKKRIKTGT